MRGIRRLGNLLAYLSARAVLAALVVIVACKDSTAPVPVSLVEVQPDSVIVTVGSTAQFSAVVTDAGGDVLTDRTVTWTSADQTKVSVSPTGEVTALAPGRIAVTATSGGKSGTGIVVSRSPLDYSIVGAHVTQGVQDAAGTIPIVLNGNAVVVNVLLASTVAGSASMQVVLRLYNSGGVLIRTDTAVTTKPFTSAPTYANPSVQFLIPAAMIQPGVRWQVVRDPKQLVPDAQAANDVLPASGPVAMSTVSVPSLKVRFVPIVLEANGGATGFISTGTIPEFMRTFRSVHPAGAIDAHVGTAFSTSTSFGNAPSGGEAPFWQQLLSELDLARIADPFEPDAHWYGVIVPPQGFNFTTFGGFSYIPSSGTNTGPTTRTAASIQLNWFNNPSQARDLVAHELGHQFGRRHAPACGAGSPIDALYPVANGLLDVPGHNVFAWQSGTATSAATIAVTTGDVMGYCFPVWASAYTYRAVMLFRGIILASGSHAAESPWMVAAAPAVRQRVLLLRGSVHVGRSITLEPAFVLDAYPSGAEPPGRYRIEGFAGDGALLFSRSLEPTELDHAPDLRHFALAIPATPALESELATIVLRGPEGESRQQVSSVAALSAEPASISTQRGPDDVVDATCPGSTRAMLLFDGNGSVRGVASGRTMRARVSGLGPLKVLCSDGVRTRGG